MAADLGFDLSVNLGNVLTIAAAVVAVVYKASTMEAKLELSDQRRVQSDKNRDVAEKRRDEEITEIKNALVEMKGVVTTVAVQKERMDNQAALMAEDKRACNDRIVRLERMLDELRHGKGLIREKV